MDDSLLIRAAERNLRRKFAGTGGTPDIAGLTTFADGLASKAQASPVTIDHSSFEGGLSGGQVTFAREIWLLAAEELLADPKFNWQAVPRTPRVVIPDFRLSTP
jgi:hypothetical protein